ncbi:MAG TPA: tRNA (adenosine(37)-N6)-dimethylallyltransferase MiaA [Spirochaetia bacterium]|nr:tRNA (adenosine(37)-N6)-dimethylallyltransferase MiaA [Spirochaetia bacterium]
MSTASSTSPPVLVLVGPTASGKTELLLRLFGPGRPAGLPEAVVVSADSMQVYRGMDIGTAKPEAATLALLPHRLIDIREISEQYTAGDFVRLADEACADIVASGKLPVVSGGTGFYLRNFLCGLPAAPASEPALRAAVAADLAALGAEALRAELAARDPESAGRIHRNDLYRLTRALEVLRATGRPLAELAAPVLPRERWRFLLLGLERGRDELYGRIESRVDAMFAAGLAEEVGRLRAAGFGPEDPGMQAIGYREFFEPGPGEGQAGLRGRIALDTRRYAKRQLTFFRALPGIRWIPPEPEALEAELRAFLGAL